MIEKNIIKEIKSIKTIIEGQKLMIEEYMKNSQGGMEYNDKIYTTYENIIRNEKSIMDLRLRLTKMRFDKNKNK